MGESEQNSGWGGWEIIVLVCIVGFVAAVAIPRHHYPNTSPANTCINNLRQIDAAKSEWALEKGKTNGTVATENDIKPYIMLNQYGRIPPCPSGGKYTIGKVGDKPTCSIDTNSIQPHVLP
jgi:hypothetical protein